MAKIAVTGVTGNLGGIVSRLQRKWNKSEKFG